MCLTHSYVLYMVAMHTEGVIYSTLFSDFFDPQVVYCQFCKARLGRTPVRESQDYLHLTFDPWISVQITIVTLVVVHATKKTILGFAD